MYVFGITGCLKDENFENDSYGIRITEIKGVAFPQTAGSPIARDILAQTVSQTIDGPFIVLEQDVAATSDVRVKLVINNALLSPDVLPLPATSYTLSAMEAIIPAGKKSTQIKITFPNATVLDATKLYGIGLSISEVTAGYKIAGNQKDIVVTFSIRNKYDGIYRMQGYHNRAPYTFPYDEPMEMRTAGTSSVIFYYLKENSIGHPIGTGPGATSWYGNAIAPVVVFDPTTDLVTSVFNNPPNSTVITMFTGAGSGVSRYDPATKKIYVYWNYNGNPLRAFFDTLTYTGPRP